MRRWSKKAVVGTGFEPVSCNPHLIVSEQVAILDKDPYTRVRTRFEGKDFENLSQIVGVWDKLSPEFKDSLAQMVLASTKGRGEDAPE